MSKPDEEGEEGAAAAAAAAGGKAAQPAASGCISPSSSSDRASATHGALHALLGACVHHLRPLAAHEGGAAQVGCARALSCRWHRSAAQLAAACAGIACRADRGNCVTPQSAPLTHTHPVPKTKP